MKPSEFTIGTEFWSAGRRWRCTDVGSRVIVAIRVDSLEIEQQSEGETTYGVRTDAEAEADGWFRGPPYPVAETVFDEDDLEGCSLERDADS